MSDTWETVEGTGDNTYPENFLSERGFPVRTGPRVGKVWTTGGGVQVAQSPVSWGTSGGVRPCPWIRTR